jgi:hypothetical protein
MCGRDVWVGCVGAQSGAHVFLIEPIKERRKKSFSVCVCVCPFFSLLLLPKTPKKLLLKNLAR